MGWLKTWKIEESKGPDCGDKAAREKVQFSFRLTNYAKKAIVCMGFPGQGAPLVSFNGKCRAIPG